MEKLPGDGRRFNGGLADKAGPRMRNENIRYPYQLKRSEK